MKRSEPEPEQLSNEEIIQIVSEISQDSGSQKDKLRVYRKKFPEFADKYPVLFEMSTQDNFDLQRLKLMLSLRNRIENSTLTQHDASAQVGQVLYDAYVKDKIKDIPPTK